MRTVEGKYGIKATILKDSISPAGVRFITYEIEYPRIVLAEFNTHRMLCRNSSSSRAIPWNKMKEQLTARPVRFGQANPGMQDKGEDHDASLGAGYTAEQWWYLAKLSAIRFAEEMFDKGFHKQVGNRLVEAHQMMKTVTSGTEWANFFWLRHHEAADPTLAELARVMWEAREASNPELLQPGEWHLPYVKFFRDDSDNAMYAIGGEKLDNGSYLDLQWMDVETAKKVSAARCAAVSFRNIDYGVEKCLEVFDRLVGDERKHASAFEHQATPMAKRSIGEGDVWSASNITSIAMTWEEGISHMDRKGQLWSGPLRGFIQFRKLIPGENYEG